MAQLAFARRSAALLRPVARSVPALAKRSAVPLLHRRSLSSQLKQSIQGDDFNEMRERALLRHVISTSTEGDPDSVTAAMDAFWHTYFNGEATAEWQLRGSALDSAIKQRQPTVAMEIGAYCGYTSVRLGRLIPKGGKLISIEIDPLYAAIATKVRRAPANPDLAFSPLFSL